VVVPKPVARTFPTQLDGFSEPVVLSYSLESMVAEKLDAILSRMEFTSRMKDFYDLYYLARSNTFDARTLQEAIFQTLQRRGTPIESDTSVQLQRLADSSLLQSRWTRFARDRLPEPLGFAQVLSTICALVCPVVNAIVQEREIFGVWIPSLVLRPVVKSAIRAG